MPAIMPALDQNVVSSWSEQEIDMYNSYPFWLASYQVAHRKTYATHSKLCGKIRWTPNMGSTMKGVRKEPSPHVRQEANPREITQAAVKDIIDVKEMTVQTNLKHQKFESRAFNFLPSFQDFLKNHLTALSTDIAQKVDRFSDLFVRTNVFHQAPYVFVCNRAGGAVVSAPRWNGLSSADQATTGKNAAWRNTVASEVGSPGNLSIINVFLADSFLREDIRAVPWSGSMDSMPKPDSPMNGKNVLVLSNEAYNQFRFDPFLLDNRRLDLDVVQEGFKGAIGDNVTCKIEDLPLRMAADGTFPAPEARELGEVYNKNESIIDNPYRDAPYEWAWLYANTPYSILDIGPPPSEFVSGAEPSNFKKMFWNGEVKFTKDFLIPAVDENNVATYDTNTYGEYMKAICHLSLGIIGTQVRNCIPILFKRVRGVAI